MNWRRGSTAELERIEASVLEVYRVETIRQHPRDHQRRHNRRRADTVARWSFIAIAWGTGRFSMNRIAAFLGLDSTTVLHALRRMAEGATPYPRESYHNTWTGRPGREVLPDQAKR